MKKISFAFAFACALAVSGADARVQGATPKAPVTVKIIAFNDFHGNLQTPGSFGINNLMPSASRPAVGGAEYLAAEVAELKARNPLNVVVGAGDFIGASPLISALFFDEPTVEVMNRVGVEFTAVGNHEFDKGAAELKRLQHGGCKITDGATDPHSCKGLGSRAPGTFDGAKFQWLAANVIETATGRTLLPPYGVKSFHGVKVAFIGMTLAGTPGIVVPAGVAGLRFLDEADTVNALVPRLRAQGVRAIVVLVHQGGVQRGPTVDINGCDGDLKKADGSDSEIARIVRRLDDAVDLVISGHTHAAYNCSSHTVEVKNVGGAAVSAPRPTGLPNRSGRRIPVTSASAFGRMLTDIDLTIDPRRHQVLSVSATNRLIDRTDPALVAAVAEDPTVRDLVAGYQTLVAPLAARVIGGIATPLASSADGAGEMPAGRLVADAQLAATQPASVGGAAIAFMNAGGVRSPGIVAPAGAGYPYPVTYGDAFTAQPFGNNLITMTLTAQQLKDLLEQQFPGCLGQTAKRVMQVSDGLKYSWSDAAAPCAKIIDVVLTPTDLTVTPAVASGPPEHIVSGGVVQDPGKRYRVTVNNFMATGGDGFAVLLGGTNPIGGPQDIDALTAYLEAGYKPPKPPYDPSLPALGGPRITRLP